MKMLTNSYRSMNKLISHKFSFTCMEQKMKQKVKKGSLTYNVNVHSLIDGALLVIGSRTSVHSLIWPLNFEEVHGASQSSEMRCCIYRRSLGPTDAHWPIPLSITGHWSIMVQLNVGILRRRWKLQFFWKWSIWRLYFMKVFWYSSLNNYIGIKFYWDISGIMNKVFSQLKLYTINPW